MLTPAFKSYLLWQLLLQFCTCCVCVCGGRCVCVPRLFKRSRWTKREATCFCQRYYDRVSAEFQNLEMLPSERHERESRIEVQLSPCWLQSNLQIFPSASSFFLKADRSDLSWGREKRRLFKRLTMNGFYLRLLMLLCFWLSLEKHNGLPDDPEKVSYHINVFSHHCCMHPEIVQKWKKK